MIRLSAVTLDCPDAAVLAAFYAEITGGKVTAGDSHWAVMEGPAGRIDFQAAAGYRPPRWPEDNQIHLDFFVTDRAAAERTVLAAGATRFAYQPNDDHCTVYADPVGHPFCLSTWELGVLPDPRLALLRGQLEGQRQHVLGILDGLPEEQLRRAVLPSGWSPLQLVRHLTLDVERFWFRGVVGGTPHEDADGWAVDPDVPAADVLSAYREECAYADSVLDKVRLDGRVAWWPEGLFGSWRVDTVEEVLVHVVVETATHAGHLDAVRELLDGRQFLVLP
jgi:uncharacterized damage-inducible protein DinB